MNSLHVIFGTAGGGIRTESSDHAANGSIGRKTMDNLDGTRIGNELVVQALEDGSIEVLPLFVFDQTDPVPRRKTCCIELVKRQPEIDQIAQFRNDRLDIAGEEINRLAILPSPICGDKIYRDVIVEHGDEGLNAVLFALTQHASIPLDAFAVRLKVISVRIDSAPTNRGAEQLETHLRKKRDVLTIVMIEVVAAPKRVELNAIICESVH